MSDSDINSAEYLKCSYCSKKFSRRRYLNRYVKRHLANHIARRRASHAFYACKTLKIKCDKLKPCSDCRSHNTECRSTGLKKEKKRRACRACATAKAKCEKVRLCSRCQKRNIACQDSSSKANSTTVKPGYTGALSTGSFPIPA
jgi:hypothetical protein